MNKFKLIVLGGCLINLTSTSAFSNEQVDYSQCNNWLQSFFRTDQMVSISQEGYISGAPQAQSFSKKTQNNTTTITASKNEVVVQDSTTGGQSFAYSRRIILDQNKIDGSINIHRTLVLHPSASKNTLIQLDPKHELNQRSSYDIKMELNDQKKCVIKEVTQIDQLPTEKKTKIQTLECKKLTSTLEKESLKQTILPSQKDVINKLSPSFFREINLITKFTASITPQIERIPLSRYQEMSNGAKVDMVNLAIEHKNKCDHYKLAMFYPEVNETTHSKKGIPHPSPAKNSQSRSGAVSR